MGPTHLGHCIFHYPSEAVLCTDLLRLCSELTFLGCALHCPIWLCYALPLCTTYLMLCSVLPLWAVLCPSGVLCSALPI